MSRDEALVAGQCGSVAVWLTCGHALSFPLEAPGLYYQVSARCLECGRRDIAVVSVDVRLGEVP